jgi:beta-lactamase class A
MAIEHKPIIIVEAVTIFILIMLLLGIVFLNPVLANRKSYSRNELIGDNSSLLAPGILTGNAISNQTIMNFEPLKEDIQKFLDLNELNSSVSVYVINLKDSSSFGINENASYSPASLTKLPIAIIIFEKIESGQLSMDTMLPIQNSDRDSGSGTLYNASVDSMKIKDLMGYMLSSSDNTATRVLAGQMTMKDLQSISAYLKLYTENISAKTINNDYITPKSEANVFLDLYFSKSLNPDDSEYILSLLRNKTDNSFNPYNYTHFSSNVTIADKYGEYYYKNIAYLHDCGIIYDESNRILYCIMTKNLNPAAASAVIGIILDKTDSYVEFYS